eukprot:8196947-Pyramimonas_sp.AAC.1
MKRRKRRKRRRTVTCDNGRLHYSAGPHGPPFGCTGAVLGSCGAILGLARGSLGPGRGPLGPSRGSLETLAAVWVVSWSRRGAILR